MAARKKKSPPADKLALYEKLVKTNPEIELKGATTAYTSLNGHMFTYMSNAGDFGIRLPKDSREEFIARFNTVLLEQYGRVMREYVQVPDEVLTDTEVLMDYLEKSYEYVKSLKPK